MRSGDLRNIMVTSTLAWATHSTVSPQLMEVIASFFLQSVGIIFCPSTHSVLLFTFASSIFFPFLHRIKTGQPSCSPFQSRSERLGLGGRRQLVLCKARPEAVSRAEPSPNRPGQAGPWWRLLGGFGLACILEKPKPSRQAAAFQQYKMWIFLIFSYFQIF